MNQMAFIVRNVTILSRTDRISFHLFSRCIFWNQRVYDYDDVIKMHQNAYDCHVSNVFSTDTYVSTFYLIHFPRVVSDNAAGMNFFFLHRSKRLSDYTIIMLRLPQ